MRYFRAFLAYFKIGFIQHIYYRGSFIFDFLGRLIGLMFIIFLWSTIYTTHTEIGGLTLSGIIVYYFFANLSRVIANPNVAYAINEHIKNGRMQTLIVRPLHPLLFYFGWIMAKRVGETIAFAIVTIIGLGIIFPLLGLAVGQIHFFAFLIFIILAIVLAYLMGAIVGMSAFWITDARPLVFGFGPLSGFLSGLTIPLSFIPEPYRNFFNYLPFKFMVSEPVKVLQGNLAGGEMIKSFFIAVGWVVVLYLLTLLVWNRGQHRFEAVGQ